MLRSRSVGPCIANRICIVMRQRDCAATQSLGIHTLGTPSVYQ